jgi:poly(beta-D-mannuronate) lyase
VIRTAAVIVFLLLLAAAWPATTVDSVAALQARIDAAKAGDVIRVKDGVYTTSSAITVRAQGTAAKPIRILAEHPGGVTIAGSHGFDVVAPAAHVTIDGFVFTHASGQTQIRPGATNVRFTHNVFEASGDGAYLTIAGDAAEIDRNEFRNKRTVGNMIDVRGVGSQVAQRVRIHHNYFHDFTSPGPGTNGAETIRFGLSGLSMSKGLGTIEDNLFVRCVGENEMLSIKSGENVIRRNTLLDSPGAQLTLRHGNGNIVRRNYLRGTDGIRIFGDRNRVSENYLEGNTVAIQIGNGDGEVAEGAPLTSHDRPDATVIALNVLVDNVRNIVLTARNKGLGATDATSRTTSSSAAGRPPSSTAPSPARSGATTPSGPRPAPGRCRTTPTRKRSGRSRFRGRSPPRRCSHSFGIADPVGFSRRNPIF